MTGVPGGGITWSLCHPHVWCLGQEDWKSGHSWNVDTWSLHVVWASSQYGGLGGGQWKKKKLKVCLWSGLKLHSASLLPHPIDQKQTQTAHIQNRLSPHLLMIGVSRNLQSYFKIAIGARKHLLLCYSSHMPFKVFCPLPGSPGSFLPQILSSRQVDPFLISTWHLPSSERSPFLARTAHLPGHDCVKKIPLPPGVKMGHTGNVPIRVNFGCYGESPLWCFPVSFHPYVHYPEGEAGPPFPPLIPKSMALPKIWKMMPLVMVIVGPRLNSPVAEWKDPPCLSFPICRLVVRIKWVNILKQIRTELGKESSIY